MHIFTLECHSTHVDNSQLCGNSYRIWKAIIHTKRKVGSADENNYFSILLQFERLFSSILKSFNRSQT